MFLMLQGELKFSFLQTLSGATEEPKFLLLRTRCKMSFLINVVHFKLFICFCSVSLVCFTARSPGLYFKTGFSAAKIFKYIL